MEKIQISNEKNHSKRVTTIVKDNDLACLNVP